MADLNQLQRVRTVWWEQDAQNAAVCMLDQSLLPRQVIVLRLTHEQQVADAISFLKVRGAPAIGVTAAFGMLLALHRYLRESPIGGDTPTIFELQTHLVSVAQMLGQTRPTAVNLFWALERMLYCIEQAVAAHTDPQSLYQHAYDEAQTIAAEDVAACLQMGRYGAELIENGDTLLTHCNAGALATSGMGTALAPIYTAHRAGKQVHVFVDETRPVLQGARLTTWELQQEGVPFTLITDNMAGHFMRHAGIKAVFVGADRIAANGDVANKIGTYSVAVLAHAHAIPFYVVAPCSSIDLTHPSGASIPIEQRDPGEVTTIRDVEIAPPGIQVANPAFDVTPHILVTAIITEKGILRSPYTAALHGMCVSENTTGKVYR